MVPLLNISLKARIVLKRVSHRLLGSFKKILIQ